MLNFLSADIRLILGSLGIILGFIAFFPYIVDTLKRKSKPHAFSWLIWAALSGIAFAVQIQAHGGFGAYVTGLAAFTSLTVAALGFILGDRSYRFIDFASLSGAGLALFLWWKTNDPTISVILLALINSIGFIPSIKKLLLHPYSETLSAWWIITIRGFLGVAALEIWTLGTSFYAGVNAVENFLFVLLIILLQAFNKR